MTSPAWLLIVAVSLAGGAQLRSPRSGDPAAIQAGGALFRERCAECHGADAKGVRGPDLTGLWTSDAIDQRVFQTIRQGVPGSIMPASSAPDDEIWAIVEYLRSVSTVATGGSTARGDAARGEATFWSACGTCHRVGDRGGRLGPDLTRVAVRLSRDALIASIRQPSASFASGYEPVTVVMRDGGRIRGVRKGEDAYSIQIMDTHERLQGYVKAEVRSVTRDPDSLMPTFSADRLSADDLGDLLAFLGTLRGSGPPSPGSSRNP